MRAFVIAPCQTAPVFQAPSILRPASLLPYGNIAHRFCRFSAILAKTFLKPCNACLKIAQTPVCTIHVPIKKCVHRLLDHPTLDNALFCWFLDIFRIGICRPVPVNGLIFVEKFLFCCHANSVCGAYQIARPAILQFLTEALHAGIINAHTHLAKIEIASGSVLDFNLHIVSLGCDIRLITDENLQSSDCVLRSFKSIRV